MLGFWRLGGFTVVDCGQAQVYYNFAPFRYDLPPVVDCGQAQVYYNNLRADHARF